jgi:oligosaccharide repeat unit polymerase
MLVSVVIFAGMEFVRITRGVMETFARSKTVVQLYQRGVTKNPTLLLYLTVHFGVLDQYLREDREHTPWGTNSLFPLYRLMKKVGADLDLPKFFQDFYKTPSAANTGSYIREIHADFGLVGVIIYPLVFGLAASWVYFMFLRRRSVYWTIVVSWAMTMVFICIFFVPTRGGEMVAGFIIAALTSLWIDKKRQVRFHPHRLK